MATTTGRDLPTTSFAILGLLTFGETSGYDLGKLVNKSVGLFWTPAKSQIYAELRRLVALGFATERHVRQEDRPDKRIYRITARGQRALRAWLEGGQSEPDVVRLPFLVKVFLGAQMPAESLIRQVKQYRKGAQDQLAALRAIEREIAGRQEYLFPHLTLKAGLAHARATVRWADDVVEELERRGRTHDG